MGTSGSQPGTTTDAAAGGAARLVLNVTSDPANLAPVRRACEAFCRRQGLDEAAAADVGLCVNEAMANVTRHAYGGATDQPVAVTAEALTARRRSCRTGTRRRGACGSTMRDWGSGVNPLSLPPKPVDPMRARRARARLPPPAPRRRLAFEPQPDGMRLVMVKRKKS